MKRFERSNGLDTALYKNYLYLFFFFFYYFGYIYIKVVKYIFESIMCIKHDICLGILHFFKNQCFRHQFVECF